MEVNLTDEELQVIKRAFDVRHSALISAQVPWGKEYTTSNEAKEQYNLIEDEIFKILRLTGKLELFTVVL